MLLKNVNRGEVCKHTVIAKVFSNIEQTETPTLRSPKRQFYCVELLKHFNPQISCSRLCMLKDEIKEKIALS